MRPRCFHLFKLATASLDWWKSQLVLHVFSIIKSNIAIRLAVVKIVVRAHRKNRNNIKIATGYQIV